MVGYWIGEPYRGKDIAMYALREMPRIAFEDLGFRRLVAPVLSPNGLSIKVLERCGYEQEDI